MQSNNSLWCGHRKRQSGKDVAVSLTKFGIQCFPEIGRMEGEYGMAFVISHEQIERMRVLNFLLKQKVNVLQRSGSPVNIIPQKDQLVPWLEIPADSSLRGFEVTVSIANENDFAGLQLYQLCFRGKSLFRLVEQLLCFFSGHTTEPFGFKKY